MHLNEPSTLKAPTNRVYSPLQKDYEGSRAMPTRAQLHCRIRGYVGAPFSSAKGQAVLRTRSAPMRRPPPARPPPPVPGRKGNRDQKGVGRGSEGSRKGVGRGSIGQV
eukprot:4493445-Pyramimonas_sp.AAC.1